MMISKSSLLSLVLVPAGVVAQSSSLTAINPIQTASSKFLGYRNSTNTQSLRDLGFAGNIGNTWILSFGDAVGTKNISNFNVNANTTAGEKNGVCLIITARDGGGLAGSDPLSYSDLATHLVGNCGDVQQMAYWCPLLPGDPDYSGLGITGVVEVNSTTGVIWTRPTISGNDLNTTGAGLALVSLTSAGPKCTRPFGKSTWGPDEPTWGQLGAIKSPKDGYTYVYANGYNSSKLASTVLLSRVPSSQVFNLSAYQYHQGDGLFTSSRIYIGNLSYSSPQNLGPRFGQGSVFWSTYYQRFVYLANGPDIYKFYASVAKDPWGPWSAPKLVYEDEVAYPRRTGYSFAEYAAAVLPNYFLADGKTIVFAYTRAAYYQGVAQVTFV